jgi:dihydroxyacetone kinase DhaKLM complex PTS-EIIA-like component DhaM
MDEIAFYQNLNLEIFLEVIKEEIMKKNIRFPVLQGMLTAFISLSSIANIYQRNIRKNFME